VTITRRLAKLESGLDPESAAIRWLHEAHEYPSLDAYTDSWTQQPTSEHPLHRIAQQVEAATKARLKGRRREAQRAADTAVHAAVFRVQLVVHIDIAATDGLRVQGLLHVALSWRLRELLFRETLAETDVERAEADTLAADWQRWSEMARDLGSLLAAKQAASLDLERRYLGGHGSLFPETARQLRDLVERIEVLYRVVLESGMVEAPEPSDETSAAAEHADKLHASASKAANTYMGWG
jgi:hypothetical protein